MGYTGRRDEEKPIAPIRGLPADITFVTQFDVNQWSEDGHTHSWLSGEEVEQVIEWLDKTSGNALEGYNQFGFLFGNTFDLVRYREDQPPEIESSRLVFWFDN